MPGWYKTTHYVPCFGLFCNNFLIESSVWTASCICQGAEGNWHKLIQTIYTWQQVFVLRTRFFDSFEFSESSSTAAQHLRMVQHKIQTKTPLHMQIWHSTPCIISPGTPDTSLIFRTDECECVKSSENAGSAGSEGNFPVPEIAPALQRNTIKHVNWEHGALHNCMLPVT